VQRFVPAMSSRFDEEECIVCELRPPGDPYFWQEWLADRLGWDLVDGQHIEPAPLTPEEQAAATAAADASKASTGKKVLKVRDTSPYAKLVYRGEKNSILKVWRSRPAGIQVIFQGVMLSVRPVGLGQFTPTQFGANGTTTMSDTPDSMEFDMNEDNNAVQGKRDLGRKLTVEESSILDVIDELGSMLPLAQVSFEMHAKTVDQNCGTGTGDTTLHGTKAADKITPYACCKAIGSLLELNITVEELLLDESNNVRTLYMHSALARMDSHTDPTNAKANHLVKNIAHLALGSSTSQSSTFPQPTIMYTDFLYILLRLKRLKEEDPNIVSPRESARGSARAGTGMGKSLGGDGDTFGKGAGVSEREIISSPRSPRNTVFSPRTSMMLANAGPSGGVMSPRPYQSLKGASASTKEAAKPPAAALAHKQVPDLSLDTVLEEAGTETLSRVKSPKANPRVTMRSPKHSPKSSPKEDDKENKEKRLASMWDTVNPSSKPAEKTGVEYTESSSRRIGGSGKDDPKLDAMRRHRIAALESRQNILEGVQTAFGDAPNETVNVHTLQNASKASLAPVVPRLRLPLEPGRDISPGSPRMDKYIEENLNHQTLIQRSNVSAERVTHGATVMHGEFRVLPMSNFPQPARFVEPRHWLTTLNFYEQLAALMPMFIPANITKGEGNRATAAVAEKNRWRKGNMHIETGEEEKQSEINEDGVGVSDSGMSVQKEQWLDADGNDLADTDITEAIDGSSNKKMQNESTSFALPIVEINSSCLAFKTVRRAFQSCDVNCLYFDEIVDPAIEPVNSEASASEIFFSDLTAVMGALHIQSRVVFAPDRSDSQSDDVFASDSYCNNPTPVQMNIEGWRTSKDLKTGLIAGTGTAMWTCMPIWWKQQWNSYLDSRRDLKKEFEKKVRKFRNAASRRKLKENETEKFLAITEIVQKLSAEIDMFGGLEGELAFESMESKDKEQAVRRLSWDIFLQFMKWVVESSVSNASEIRHLIAKEIWKNSKNTAVSSAAKFVIAKRIEQDAKDKILAMAPKRKIDKKDKDFSVHKSLFVGYFPKTEVDIQEEKDAAIEEEKERERQKERDLHEKVRLEIEEKEAKRKHAAELREADDVRDKVEQEALADNAAADLKVALEQIAKVHLESGVAEPVEAVPLTEDDLEQLKPSANAGQIDLAATFAEADEEVAAEENQHTGKAHTEPNTADVDPARAARAALAALSAAAADGDDDDHANADAVTAATTTIPAITATTFDTPVKADAALLVATPPTSARERFKLAQTEAKEKKQREDEGSTAAPVTPAVPKEKLSARERFKVAQAEKERKEKEEEEAAVADMLAMAAEASEGQESSPPEKAEPTSTTATAAPPLSARQQFKNAQINKGSEKDTAEVEEVLD